MKTGKVKYKQKIPTFFSKEKVDGRYEEGTDRNGMHRASQRQLSNTKRMKIVGGLKHSQAPIDVNSTRIGYLLIF